MSPNEPSTSPGRKRLSWGLAALGLLLAVSFAVIKARSSRSARPPHRNTANADFETDSSLKVSPALIDFGVVRLGERKTESVTLENTGSQPVRVARTIMGCTCLSEGLEGVEIRPGETHIMNLIFTGLPGRRIYRTHATLILNSLKQPRIPIAIHALIEQDLIAEPDTLSFGKVDVGQEVFQKLTLKHKSGAPFSVKEARCSRPEFSFTWTPLDGGGFEVKCVARPLRTSFVTETVEFVVDPPTKGNPTVILALEGEGDITHQPPVCAPQPGQEGMFELTLSDKKNRPLKVESVQEAHGTPLKIEQATLPDGRLKVTLRFEEGSPHRHVVGEFRIKLAGIPDLIHVPFRSSESVPTSDHP